MKFACEKYLLLSAIGTASKAASGKSPIPALEGLLVEAENEIKITGYNLKEGIYTTFPADISEPGAVILGARLFGEIVRSLPDGIVTVTAGRGNMTTITCSKSDFSIIGASADGYPEIPAVDYKSAISIPQNILKDMISQTIFAVSDNESRPVYTGAMFEIENGVLSIIAVDGYRLALRREEIQGSAEDCSFIVPGNALSDLEKICSNTDEHVKITLGSKHISFTIDKTVLISRRLEGDFMNYRKSIPASFSINLTADRAGLTRAVERVSLIIDDKIKNPIHCVFGDGEIRISCMTALGKAEDICAVEGNGNDMEIGFNNRYLLDVLKVAPAEKLKVCLNSASSPCVITPEDGSEKFLYMILPVRLRAGD